MADSIVKEFPDNPDADCTLLLWDCGETEVDVNTEGIGYGYVRPATAGYECGGAIFDPGSHTVRPIETHTVRVE